MKNYVYSYSTDNLGDEIQSIAASRLMPHVDGYIERDRMSSLNSNDEAGLLIANGWYCHNPYDFPPPPRINPFYISVHIAHKNLLSREAIFHFRGHSPIGCRDSQTLNIFRQLGIPAYFSGCLTTTLSGIDAPKNNSVFLVDIDDCFKDWLPKEVLEVGRWVTHDPKVSLDSILEEANVLKWINRLPLKSAREIKRKYYLPWVSYRQQMLLSEVIRVSRFERASNLLSMYSGAKLVVTSRLHCALPCLGMGVPVIFLSKSPQNPRFYPANMYLKIYGLEDQRKINWNPEPVTSLKLKKHKEFLRLAIEKAVLLQNNPFKDESLPSLENLVVA